MSLYPARAALFINVADFGASPSAIASVNDAAIAAAIAAVPSGGTVFFPFGTYLISTSIIIDADYVTLRADEATLQINASSDPAYALIVGNTKNVQECHIIGLNFQGRANASTTGAGIHFRSNGGSIERTRVNQFGGNGIQIEAFSGTIFQVYLSDVWLVQNGYNSSHTHDNLVVGTNTSDSEYHRVISYGDSGKTTTRHGFQVSAGNHKFVDCHAYFCSSDGFNQAQGESTQIIGGEWETNGRHGINIVTTTQNITIKDAHCFANNNHDISANNVAGLVIEGCQCTSGVGDDCIAIFGTSTYGVIANCIATPTNTGQNAITCSTNKMSIHDCYAAGLGGGGIGIALNGATSCDVHDNYVLNGITESNSANTNTIHDNNVVSGTITLTGASSIARNNRGYNPVGHAVTQPSVPATTVAQTNTTGVDCTVIVTGGTVSAIAIGGTATGLTSGTFRVPAGQTITLTYTVAPTWQWFGD